MLQAVSASIQSTVSLVIIVSHIITPMHVTSSFGKYPEYGFSSYYSLSHHHTHACYKQFRQVAEDNTDGCVTPSLQLAYFPPTYSLSSRITTDITIATIRSRRITRMLRDSLLQLAYSNLLPLFSDNHWYHYCYHQVAEDNTDGCGTPSFS
ncbi:hypothetical protein J6590_065082 [Homalodisca vitripennis]|nr:hypothetical protein J6590_065082 [Homalodisca vitripennis]